MSVYILDNCAAPAVLPDANIEFSDKSLGSQKAPSLAEEINLCRDDFNTLFLDKYSLEYISEHAFFSSTGLRVVTHPEATDTCFEKAEILGSWDPLNIIKVFYLECSINGLLYAVVVPETGCFIDRVHIKNFLDLPEDAFLKKAERLPENMSFGTCSPFIQEQDLVANGGSVEKVLFDEETLEHKREDQTIDDFSFGLDHRMSIQLNYCDCFNLLKQKFPGAIESRPVLKLTFKEKLVRKKGKIKIAYDFNSLNYGTAKFINSIHGFGDVSIFNDYVDELNLPEVINTRRKLD